MTDRHKKALKHACCVLKEIPYVRRIYLFGSCARGDETYQSDVDLFILTESGVSKDQLFDMKCKVISDDLSLPDVNLITADSLQKLTSVQFVNNIIKDGVLVWKKK